MTPRVADMLELLTAPACRPSLTARESAVAVLEPPDAPARGPLEIARDQGEATFQVFSGVLTAALENDRMVLRGVASSTSVDLHGDTMMLSALEDMERAAVGMTMFMNHRYDVPDDVFGTVREAKIRQNGVDAKGDVMYELGIVLEVTPENDRAVKSWKMIDRGTKLGFSIGALIPHDGGATRDKKSGALTIHHVKLLEISCVGIPANQDSWATGTKSWAGEARKGMDRREAWLKALGATDIVELQEASGQTTQLGNPTLTIRDGRYRIEGSMEHVQLDGDDAIDQTAAATCPDCGKPKGSGGDCSNPMHSKDVDPDVTDSRIRIIEVDTSDGDSSSSDGDGSSEGADSSEPSEELAAPDPDVTASGDEAAAPAEPVAMSVEHQALLALGGSYPTLAAGIAALIEQNATLSLELAEERRLRMQAEENCQAMARGAGVMLTQTQSLVASLGNLPMGRQADPRVLVDLGKDLSHLEGIYDRSFLATLQRPPTRTP